MGAPGGALGLPPMKVILLVGLIRSRVSKWAILLSHILFEIFFVPRDRP
jgi:hypothetical protein